MPFKDKYTDPELRDEVKEEIHQSDKGGAPGQWSARKAQMMASEYKKRGGDYTTDKKDQDESQQHLSKWGEEEWQTKEGSAHAKQDDGTQKRYLPKKAWENMTEEEKEATDEKKQEESKEGKQFVGNTQKAKQSRKKASEEEDEEYAVKKQNEKAAVEDGPAEEENDDDGEYVEDDDGETPAGSERDETEDTEDAPKGRKRGRPAKTDSPANKKQKSNSGKGKQKDTVGSRHDKADAPAEQGSNNRLPEKGQQVHWKSMPGWVDGEVIEIAKEQKKVEGKDVKANEDDPRIVLKSNSSGKICVHKPEAVYFD
ncbi:uncharacterized protein LTHEOB_11657 [Lasiodiplodia theobromae]|uniref:Hypervirulence associated protein TUDOR domain-containing protein n=1 Tax=Lasiodiplodia theobromae TaxID=45133 RepID=A0A5N5DIZ9_9PEZI|nr:uncharacterized protein LTHEOB_11657 [Lasiodiplodia theobromae]KAB2577878.1 hypothetical protein DBV05_g3504 [Lasiodiplodia theobromae]KAF4537108.1 hypothetical protein LTHEOB_11657 [Lasiodiplodia theobromae]